MIQPGSISSGTMRLQDLIPTFLEFLREEALGEYKGILEEWRDCLPHTGERDIFQSEQFLKWIEGEPEEAGYLLNEDIWEAMDDLSPRGMYFGAHPGDGADYGYWACEDHPTDPF